VCLQQERAVSACSVDAYNYSARGLSASLGVSKTEVNASIRRSIDVGMAIKDRKSGYPKTNKKALLEFVIHGLKYVFPAKPAEIVRGIPTAFSAPMLDGKLLSMGEYFYVWPYAEGIEKGQSVQPLFKSVPKAVLDDNRLYAYLALIDAIRVGNPREANLAAELFEQKLMSDA
jgi:biotin operon repressor